MHPFIFICPSDSPHQTLAAEEVLLDTLRQDSIILCLYRHDDCVVIGRSQNAWAECRFTALRRGGGVLARRISGGGAVFHDPGNLNFSFIVPRSRYDLQKQYGVLISALRSLGIDAVLSGRNDLTADGRKFSGNAFCIRKDTALHHGTLLIDTDISKLESYLQVSTDKIRAKGIASVRSRVINLSELCPGLTPDIMSSALIDAFSDAYGPSASLQMTDSQRQHTEQLTQRNAGWEWIFGRTLPFGIQFGSRFSWGGIEFICDVKDAVMQNVKVYSDAMDEAYVSRLESALHNTPFTPESMAGVAVSCAVSPAEERMAHDLAELFASHV